jgi:hypothetical protein
MARSHDSECLLVTARNDYITCSGAVPSVQTLNGREHSRPVLARRHATSGSATHHTPRCLYQSATIPVASIGVLMKVANCLLYWIALWRLVFTCGGSAYAQADDAPKGVWESNNNRSGAVGLELQDAGQKDGRAILGIGVYERANEGLRCGDENFFEPQRRDPIDTSIVSYSKGLLVIHYKSRTGGNDSIDLQLTYDQNEDKWEGHFHRGLFDEQLVLKRVPKSPVVLQPCAINVGDVLLSNLKLPGGPLHSRNQIKWAVCNR